MVAMSQVPKTKSQTVSPEISYTYSLINCPTQIRHQLLFLLSFCSGASTNTGLDISSLDAAVQHYCTEGIAQSTQKTYQSALRKFTEFSFTYLYSLLTPFPVSEAILCYFATYLGMQGLSPSTIKCYLAGIQHIQITL